MCDLISRQLLQPSRLQTRMPLLRLRYQTRHTHTKQAKKLKFYASTGLLYLDRAL